MWKVHKSFLKRECLEVATTYKIWVFSSIERYFRSILTWGWGSARVSKLPKILFETFFYCCNFHPQNYPHKTHTFNGALFFRSFKAKTWGLDQTPVLPAHCQIKIGEFRSKIFRILIHFDFWMKFNETELHSTCNDGGTWKVFFTLLI